MPRSDPPADAGIRPDWRGGVILAWVVCFGLLYGKMVVSRRGGQVHDWVARLVREVRPTLQAVGRPGPGR